MENLYNLERFIAAQERTYAAAYSELLAGKKRTHWIWFIFPQIVDLGTSEMSRKFSLKSKNEVLAYYNHSVLGKRYQEVCSILLEHKQDNILSIFGHPEYLKVYSSISLFHLLIKEDILFEKILDKYFDGRIDDKTLSILSTL